MAKTATQRQRDYRLRRNDGDGDRRINTWIATGAGLALDRLARHHGTTRRAMLERLILAADSEIIKGLDLDTPEWEGYFSVTQ